MMNSFFVTSISSSTQLNHTADEDGIESVHDMNAAVERHRQVLPGLAAAVR